MFNLAFISHFYAVVICIIQTFEPKDAMLWNSKCNASKFPSGTFLPLTELLQSPFRTEFSMGSQSLWRHRLFLRSSRRSLWCCRDLWGDRRSSMRRHWSLRDSLNIIKHLNIVKYHETHIKHCDTSWTTSKTSWNTLKTLWNIIKHSNTRRSMRRHRRSMRRRRRSARSFRRLWSWYNSTDV